MCWPHANIGILLGFFASATLYEHFGMFMMCLLSVIGGSSATLVAITLKEKDEPNKVKPKVRNLLEVVKNKRLYGSSLSSR